MPKVDKKKSTNHNRSMKLVRSGEYITYVDKEVISGIDVTGILPLA